MKSRILLLFAAALLAATHLTAQDFKKQVIYQIVTDRFFDGDTTNDNPAESPSLYDSTKTNWFAYWGGDLAGIQQQMSYLKGMGITAIWISPTVNNENLNLNSNTPISAPYHGYDARDFMQVEEHFGDNSNSWSAFDNLVSAAHSNGIKVIVDWANNHSNYNGGGEKGALYNNGVFMASDSNDPNGYFHHNPNITDYNDRYQLQYYTLLSLEDLNQENATIDNYLKPLSTNSSSTAPTPSASMLSSTQPGAGNTPSPTPSSPNPPATSSVNGSITILGIRCITMLTSLRIRAGSMSWTLV